MCSATVHHTSAVAAVEPSQRPGLAGSGACADGAGRDVCLGHVQGNVLLCAATSEDNSAVFVFAHRSAEIRIGRLLRAGLLLDEFGDAATMIVATVDSAEGPRGRDARAIMAVGVQRRLPAGGERC